MDIAGAYCVRSPHATVALGAAAWQRAKFRPKQLPATVIAATRGCVTFVMGKELARAHEREITLLLG